MSTNTKLGRLVATASVNVNRGECWLRFNKTEGDNRSLIHDLGGNAVHGMPVTVDGTERRFRLWWYDEKNPSAPKNNAPHLASDPPPSNSEFTAAGRAIEALIGQRLNSKDKVPFDAFACVERGYRLVPVLGCASP
jgi:hypothetical protein